MIDIVMDETATIHVKGSADIHHAAALYEGLARVLRTCAGDVALDLGGLTELDTTGVQLLIAFKRSVTSVRVQSCPDKFRDLLERTGLVQLLL